MLSVGKISGLRMSRQFQTETRPERAGRGIMGYAPPENHVRRNAGSRRSRDLGLLRGLPMQPFDRSPRRSMGRRRKATLAPLIMPKMGVYAELRAAIIDRVRR